MNKKGADTRTILWIFYILLVLIISYFLYNFINDASSGKLFTKEYFINDLGLTFDTLSSANYDLEIKYNYQDNYDIQFSKGNLKLTGENTIYHYAQDTNFNTFYGEYAIKNGSMLLINKKNNVISVNLKENEVK